MDSARGVAAIAVFWRMSSRNHSCSTVDHSGRKTNNSSFAIVSLARGAGVQDGFFLLFLVSCF